MEEQTQNTQEEHDARESHRKAMIRITRELAEFEADPHKNDDVPPHLVGRI